jgi:hypothetical protein
MTHNQAYTGPIDMQIGFLLVHNGWLHKVLQQGCTVSTGTTSTATTNCGAAHHWAHNSTGYPGRADTETITGEGSGHFKHTQPRCLQEMPHMLAPLCQQSHGCRPLACATKEAVSIPGCKMLLKQQCQFKRAG